MEAFADKLDFVMKALSISRGRLGADLAVDKLADGPPHQKGLFLIGLEEWLSLEKLRDAAASSGEAGRAAEGFWRVIAPMPGMPGHYGQSFMMSSATPGGANRVETGFFSMRRIGWSVVIGSQFFSCVTGTADGYFGFTICTRVAAERVEVMDGIFLGCLADNGGVPLAMPIVMDRIGDLSGDVEADAARLGERLSTNPLLAAADVPEATRRRLGESVGADPAASPLLMMAAMTSLARGGKARPAAPNLRVVSG